MRFCNLRSAALALCLLAFAGLLTSVCIPGAFAQGIITGGVSGTVADQTGAVIPKANVTATNDATGTTFRRRPTGRETFISPISRLAYTP